MPGQNFAGNIIVNLANLPDFLRNPILKKRMLEFFTLPDAEREEVIVNALEAGPTIPFPNFSKLLKTWLKILATLTEEQADGLFLAYVLEIARSPQKIIAFNLDGILEIFLSLDDGERETLAKTLRRVIGSLDEEKKRRIMIIVPDNVKRHLGL